MSVDEETRNNNIGCNDGSILNEYYAFASSSLLVSEEGIGIEVHNPADFGVGEIATRGYVNDNYLSVLGGTLWTTWDGSVQLSPWLDQTLTNNQSWASTR